MAYVKQTWANGDTVTAAKLNHMEDGIEAASSGGGNPQITIECVSFSNASHYMTFAIGKWDDEENAYVAQEFYNERLSLTELIDYFLGMGGTYTRYIYDMPVPKADDMVLVFLPWSNGYTTECSGNVEPNAVTLVYGSVAQCKVITGDCTIRFTEL